MIGVEEATNHHNPTIHRSTGIQVELMGAVEEEFNQIRQHDSHSTNIRVHRTPFLHSHCIDGNAGGWKGLSYLAVYGIMRCNESH